MYKIRPHCRKFRETFNDLLLGTNRQSPRLLLASVITRGSSLRTTIVQVDIFASLARKLGGLPLLGLERIPADHSGYTVP